MLARNVFYTTIISKSDLIQTTSRSGSDKIFLKTTGSFYTKCMSFSTLQFLFFAESLPMKNQILTVDYVLFEQ